jgi:hypothetical protein
MLAVLQQVSNQLSASADLPHESTLLGTTNVTSKTQYAKSLAILKSLNTNNGYNLLNTLLAPRLFLTLCTDISDINTAILPFCAD